MFCVFKKKKKKKFGQFAILHKQTSLHYTQLRGIHPETALLCYY